MKNFEQLASQITAVIRENGTGAITGAQLQEVLLAMKDKMQLSSFEGIATPSTTVTTDYLGEHFYIAYAAGTYSNFDGAVLDGSAVTMFYKMPNSVTWSHVQLNTDATVVDSTITETSENPVKSSAIHAALAEKADADELTNLSRETDNIVGGSVGLNDSWKLSKGYYVQVNGGVITISNSVAWDSWLIPYAEGYSHITATLGSNNVAHVNILFLSAAEVAAGNVVSYLAQPDKVNGVYDADVPSGTRYILVCNRIASQENPTATLTQQAVEKSNKMYVDGKLAEIGEHFENIESFEGVAKTDTEVLTGTNFRVGTYFDGLTDGKLNIAVSVDRTSATTAPPSTETYKRGAAEFPVSGKKGIEDVVIDGKGHTWTGQFVEITGDCTIRNLNFYNTGIYLSSVVNASYSVNFENCVFTNSYITESSYEHQTEPYSELKFVARNCYFAEDGNMSGGVGGIQFIILGVCRDSLIENCSFEGIEFAANVSKTGRGIKYYGADGLVVRNCRFRSFFNAISHFSCPEGIAEDSVGCGYVRNCVFENNTFINCKEETITNDRASGENKWGNSCTIVSYTTRTIGFSANNKTIADVVTIRLGTADSKFVNKTGFMLINMSEGFDFQRSAIASIEKNVNDTDNTLYDITLEDGSAVKDSQNSYETDVEGSESPTQFAIWAAFYRNQIVRNKFLGCQVPICLHYYAVDNVVSENVADIRSGSSKTYITSCGAAYYGRCLVDGSLGNLITDNVMGSISIDKSGTYSSPASGLQPYACSQNVIANNRCNSVNVYCGEKNIVTKNVADKYNVPKGGSTYLGENSYFEGNNNPNVSLRPTIASAIHSQYNTAYHPAVSLIPIYMGRTMKIEMVINVAGMANSGGQAPLFGSYYDGDDMPANNDGFFALRFTASNEGQYPVFNFYSYDVESKFRRTGFDYTKDYVTIVAERDDSNMKLTFDGTEVINTASSLTVNSGSTKLCFFANKKFPALNSTAYLGTCLIKHIRVWSESILIRDFYPTIGRNGGYALSDGVKGDYIELLAETEADA